MAVQSAIGQIGVTQTIAYDATTVATNAFGAQTRWVRLVSSSACNFRIGDGAQTATAADPLLPASWETVVVVVPGQRIAAIKASGGLLTATAGTLWVTELT